MIRNFRKKSWTGRAVSLVLATSISLIAMTGCSSSNNVSQNNTNKDSKTTSSEKASSTQNSKTTTPTSPVEPIKPTEPTSTGVVSSKNSSNGISNDNSTKTQTSQKSNNPSSEVYKNINFGLCITFPASWKNNYTIKETSEGIFVYFKPKQKISDGQGLFFCILKKSKALNELMFDSVAGKKELNINGTSYLLGGPTDIGFPDNNPEYSTFRQLKSELPNIINSIKSIK